LRYHLEHHHKLTHELSAQVMRADPNSLALAHAHAHTHTHAKRRSPAEPASAGLSDPSAKRVKGECVDTTVPSASPGRRRRQYACGKCGFFPKAAPHECSRTEEHGAADGRFCHLPPATNPVEQDVDDTLDPAGQQTAASETKAAAAAAAAPPPGPHPSVASESRAAPPAPLPPHSYVVRTSAVAAVWMAATARPTSASCVNGAQAGHSCAQKGQTPPPYPAPPCAPSADAPRHAKQEAPKEFMCPITKAVMRDPVVAQDGFSYERAAIGKWFEQHNEYS